MRKGRLYRKLRKDYIYIHSITDSLKTCLKKFFF